MSPNATLEEPSSTKFSSGSSVTSQISMLLDFQPMEFIVELFQTVDNVICDCLDSLKASLDEKSFPTQYRADIDKGIQSLQDCLVSESDFQFDLFELYTLYNIFRIPSNLGSLPPSATFFSQCIDIDVTSKLDEEIEEILKDIRSLRYCKRRFERELRLLNSDLEAFDVIRPILQKVTQEDPLFLSKDGVATTLNLLRNTLKSSEHCSKLKQEIESRWVPSNEELPHAENPRLKLDISSISLTDLQKMTSKLKQQF